MEQGVELKRLGDEVGGALLDGVNGVLDRAVPRDHDRHDVGVACERRVEHVPPVDAGEAQVGDEDVVGEVGQPAHGFFAAVGLLDNEALVCETLGDGFAQRLFVIYDQQMFRGFRHLVGLAVF